MWRGMGAAVLLGAVAATAFAEKPDRPKVKYTPVVLSGDPAPGMPGKQFTAFPYHSVLNDSSQTVFMTAFGDYMGSGPEALYGTDKNGPHLVAALGQQAPGSAQGVQISSFDINYYRINHTGQVSFEAWLTGPGILNSGDDNTNAGASFLWTDGKLEKVAQYRDPAPGTGLLWRYFEGTTLGEDGSVLVRGGLTDFRDGIWYGKPGNLQLIALEGQAIAGHSDLQYGTMYVHSRPIVSSSGNIVFFSHLQGPGAGSYSGPKSAALFIGKSGDVKPVVFAGDAAPGTSTTFRDFQSYRCFSANSDANVIFSATLGDGSYGLFTASRSDQRLIAKTPDAAPGIDGAKFDFFHGASINDKGEVAFLADIAPGDDARLGIWAGKPGKLALITARGLHAPGTEPGVTFGWFLSEPVINKDGQVAFFGSLEGPGSRGDGDYGIWATGHAGDLRLIARVGDEFAVTKGDVRTISAVSYAGIYGGHIVSFNEDSDLSFLIKFTDGSQGIFNATVLPEPAALGLIVAGLCMGLARRRAKRGRWRLAAAGTREPASPLRIP